jgi:hypothetical protein
VISRKEASEMEKMAIVKAREKEAEAEAEAQAQEAQAEAEADAFAQAEAEEQLVAENAAEQHAIHVPTPDPTLVVTIAVTNKNCYLLARRRADERELYITPPRLLHGCKQLFEKLRGMKVWDGCNGLGSISNFLRGEGFDVVASDKYVYDGVVQQKIDFLDRTITPPAGVEAIIMNPPFRQAKKFLERALEFGKNL